MRLDREVSRFSQGIKAYFIRPYVQCNHAESESIVRNRSSEFFFRAFSSFGFICSSDKNLSCIVRMYPRVQLRPCNAFKAVLHPLSTFRYLPLLQKFTIRIFRMSISFNETNLPSLLNNLIARKMCKNKIRTIIFRG